MAEDAAATQRSRSGHCSPALGWRAADSSAAPTVAVPVPRGARAARCGRLRRPARLVDAHSLRARRLAWPERRGGRLTRRYRPRGDPRCRLTRCHAQACLRHGTLHRELRRLFDCGARLRGGHASPNGVGEGGHDGELRHADEDAIQRADALHPDILREGRRGRG